MTGKAVTIIGMSSMGCAELTSHAASRIAAATVLMGSERLTDFFPQFSGRIITLSGNIKDFLQHIKELSSEENVCVLASHDPLFFGIGSRIIAELGAEHVEVIPAPTSIQVAFSRINVKWDDAELISLHGRPIEGLITRLRGLAKVALLTDSRNSPPKIAAHLLTYGETGWDAYLCENLASADEKIRRLDIKTLAALNDCAALSVLILLATAPELRRSSPVLASYPDDSYLHEDFGEGLITKQEIRIQALFALAIGRNDVIWDIGSGSGAVAIEAAGLAAGGKVYAIEKSARRIELIHSNALSHKIDNITVIAGSAPQACRDLDAPDAIFIGGSGEEGEALLAFCFEALKPGGRMVITAVTLEKGRLVEQFCAAKNLALRIVMAQMTRVIAGPGPLHRYKALNPIHIYTLIKD
jgi:precorrin-6Y C5,15-methyltransferase (decarboxylating)